MAKVLDLNRSVFELTEQYPELIGILKELGFTEITKPAMLHSVGKLTTIPKGAKRMRIPMTDVIAALFAHGFALAGEPPAAEQADEAAVAGKPATQPTTDRTEQLKGYLKRLGAGESLERVRADFVREFGAVEASEIMRAEQALLREGTPLAEVQKLCDVHSALFHGATQRERIENAERAVRESLQRQAAYPQADYGSKAERAAALEAIAGHPLSTLTEENEALSALLKSCREALSEGRDTEALLKRVRELSIHYAKKGDLLYPLLKVKYGISGPSDVMWTVDDEIRDELGALEKERERGEWWHTRLENVLKRAEEMIYKEQNILFPIAAVNFTDAEWKGIYRDAKDYAPCFGTEPKLWDEAEREAPAAVAAKEGEIVMPGGHLTLEQLTALLNTIPLEITFVDADNINRFFNEGPKVFKRPGMAIDREVFSCHPPKIEPMVRAIIDDFRAGRRDSVPVWTDKGGRTMLVTYMAVRDAEKQYLGTVELVQDMEFFKAHFGIES